MESGRGGMGMRKHRTSGHASKSPRLRLALKLDAEKDSRARKDSDMSGSVDEALAKERRKRR